jgi:hypothetical protein
LVLSNSAFFLQTSPGSGFSIVPYLEAKYQNVRTGTWEHGNTGIPGPRFYFPPKITNPTPIALGDQRTGVKEPKLTYTRQHIA